MRIFAKLTFLDDRDRFEEGQTYDILDERGMYFISRNWASYAGKTPFWRRLRRKNA